MTGTRVAIAAFCVQLAACASSPPILVAVQPQTWILPLSAQNDELVCAIVMEYPGRRCATVGDIRRYLASVKAD